MAELVFIALLALIFWIASAAHKAGKKEAEVERRREIMKENTPDWNTYRGQIASLEDDVIMPGLCSLNFREQPRALGTTAMKRALADCFGDESVRGKTIIDTIDSDEFIQGFTPVEHWPGPEIPQQGLSEKHVSRLQPKHKNQFADHFLRQQIENDPNFKDVRFY